MKKLSHIISLTILLSLSTLVSSAQEGCGFVPTEDFMSRIDVLKTLSSYKTTGVSDTIPISLHLVANSSGFGRHSITKMLNNICEVNEDYEPSGIYFWIKWPLHYIDNTSFYDHTFQNGSIMMYQNNVPGSLNLYVVDDPASTCGYYSPQLDAIALAKSCIDPGENTIAHELGHLLNLPHTFSGWEFNSNPPNPELVTRGSGKNCDYAGDKFCDTEADYLSTRWSCPYTAVKYDANGDAYRPDSSLYMNYTSDACQSRFSPEQIAVMRNDKASRWPTLDQNYPSYVDEFDIAQITNITDTLYNDRIIKWNAVSKADAYHVQVALKNIPLYVKFDTMVVGGTELDLTRAALNPGTEYIVRIKPVNGSSVCVDFSPDQSFLYLNIANPNEWPTSINSIDDSELKFYVSTSSGTPTLHYTSELNDEIDIVLYDIMGRALMTTSAQVEIGSHSIVLPQSTIYSGQIGLLQITQKDGSTQSLKFLSE